MFLLSGHGYIGKLLELPQGCQGFFHDSRGKVGFVSRCRNREEPHLTLRGESPGFCRVAAGNLVFLSSYNGELRDLLLLPQESPVSMRVVRGLSGFLCSRCLGQGSLLALRLDLRVPLQCPHGSQGSSGVSTGESGLVSCGDMQVRCPLDLKSNVRLPVGLT